LAIAARPALSAALPEIVRDIFGNVPSPALRLWIFRPRSAAASASWQRPFHLERTRLRPTRSQVTQDISFAALHRPAKAVRCEAATPPVAQRHGMTHALVRQNTLTRARDIKLNFVKPNCRDRARRYALSSRASGRRAFRGRTGGLHRRRREDRCARDPARPRRAEADDTANWMRRWLGGVTRPPPDAGRGRKDSQVLWPCSL
jgi:hypothetical protein